MRDLKPCPRCGGTAVIIEANCKKQTVRVSCMTRKDITAGPVRFRSRSTADMLKAYDAAAGLWNKGTL